MTLDLASGLISGTPVSGSGGSYTFTVTAEDTDDVRGSASYTLKVEDGAVIATSAPSSWLPFGAMLVKALGL